MTDVAMIDIAVAAMHYDKRIRRITKYFSPKRTLKITRQRRPSGRERSETFIVSVGKPNYAERKFIAACQKAKRKFPLQDNQINFYPRRKK